MAPFIDLSIYIDTPLDVAMARRILRDYPPASDSSPGELLSGLREELAHYLEKARYPYLDMDRNKATSDLILDGWQSLEALKEQVFAHLRQVP